MKKVTIRKIILVSVVCLFLLNVILVRAQGVSLGYWAKLGFPTALKIYVYNLDNYPGHSLECIRFPESLIKSKKKHVKVVYTKEGDGFKKNGYSVHIGDTRTSVKNQFRYLDPESDGTYYELGCFYCLNYEFWGNPPIFYDIYCTYDENDVLVKMIIEKNKH